MDSTYIIVLVTTANKSEAEKISEALLKEKIIACANIISPVTSFSIGKAKWTSARNA